jgi:hypothetical protein
MASIRNRKVSIQWKLNPDAFAIANKTVLVDTIRRFGSTTTAVNTILTKEELLKFTMPVIIGLNPSDLGWQKAIANYWNSLAVDIPENGKDLEIGFSFDIDDEKRSKYIVPFMTSNKLKTDEDLATYVMGKVPEEDKYKYGAPIKPEDYLLWVYSKHYRDVANEVDDINNSKFIRFYIHDDEIVKLQKEALIDLTIQAQDKFMEVLKSNEAKDKISNILCVLEPTIISSLDKLTDNERRNKLFELFQKDAKLFINIVDDSNLHTKALVEKLLSKGILRKITNTDIVVDVEDPSIVLGNTISETVTWFSIEANKAKISEYKNRLKV